MTENLHRRHFLCFVTKLQKTFIVHADKCLYTSMWNDEKRFQEINLKNKQRQKQDLENRNHMLRELIVSRDMSVASHWSVIARGHGARQIMQSMDPALLLTLWLRFKCEWKGRFMNLSVIVKQRLKSDVLGNRERHLCLIVARSSGVSFLASGTRLVLSMFGHCRHRLCCSDALTKQEFSSKKNLERTQGTFL